MEADLDVGMAIRKRLWPRGEGDVPSLILDSPMESPTRFDIQEGDDRQCARRLFRLLSSPLLRTSLLATGRRGRGHGNCCSC